MVQPMQHYIEAENFASDTTSLTRPILKLYSLHAFPFNKTSLHLFPLFAMKSVTSWARSELHTLN